MTTQDYDALAAAFYDETGMMAPGKDVPAGFGGPSYEERTQAFHAWLAKRTAPTTPNPTAPRAPAPRAEGEDDVAPSAAPIASSAPRAGTAVSDADVRLAISAYTGHPLGYYSAGYEGEIGERLRIVLQAHEQARAGTAGGAGAEEQIANQSATIQRLLGFIADKIPGTTWGDIDAGAPAVDTAAEMVRQHGPLVIWENEDGFAYAWNRTPAENERGDGHGDTLAALLLTLAPAPGDRAGAEDIDAPVSDDEHEEVLRAEASALAQLDEAQRALIVLFDMHLTRGKQLPELPPEVERVVAKARNDVRKHDDLVAVGMDVAMQVFEQHRPARGDAGEVPRDE